MKKYKVCGPVQDGQFSCWMVVGPRGGYVAEFLTKKAALQYVRGHSGKLKVKAKSKVEDDRHYLYGVR